ncbi:PgaD family protein [Herbaspirillum sp. RV1423]|uniref:PgaD family protein n=1 Tax=Herbaspirillum sp. RV1423 TaxID=1443993 RepID=UPI0004BAA72A|nr:PgaD family protein [Herbaspirillum sp. RV1423]
MKSQLIINLNTSKRPLIRARDSVLFFSCWAMWGAVFLAVVNGSEWSELGTSFQHWLMAQEIFLRSLLASFHIPTTYVMMLLLLVVGFSLWSAANLVLSPPLRAQGATPPLTLEDMARHFHLDLALVDAMQKEKQVLVFHALSGVVTELRRVQNRPQHQLLEA